MRKATVYLEYQNIIAGPPVPKEALYKNACANDESTIEYWRHTWLGNATANKQRFGSFKEHSVAQEFNKLAHGTALVAGSGPSLKINAQELAHRGSIPLISCLHNFHYFEDLGLKPDYYVTLDAGKITIPEISDGGSKSPEEYWELTKDRTLVAFISTDPELLHKWKGRILFYNATIPSRDFCEQMDAIERFNIIFATGGNVLGACLYFAKAILGCHQSIFVGADFSFSYGATNSESDDRCQFHAWKSDYDQKMGGTMRVTDIYGNKVHTWPSYYGFKQYFDSVSLRAPGIYYNCTEGGCLGSYNEGNIASIQYLDLKDCLKNFCINDGIKQAILAPDQDPKILLYA